MTEKFQIHTVRLDGTSTGRLFRETPENTLQDVVKGLRSDPNVVDFYIKRVIGQWEVGETVACQTKGEEKKKV